MLIKATAIVKFSGIYKWDIINPLKDKYLNPIVVDINQK